MKPLLKCNSFSLLLLTLALTWYIWNINTLYPNKIIKDLIFVFCPSPDIPEEIISVYLSDALLKSSKETANQMPENTGKSIFRATLKANCTNYSCKINVFDMMY